MKDANILKLLLKLVAIIGIIWGLGWIIYENSPLGKHFTSTNYQNILLVLMSATWLIILLSMVGNEPQTKTLYQPPLRTTKKKSTKKFVPKKEAYVPSLTQQVIDKHLIKKEDS